MWKELLVVMILEVSPNLQLHSALQSFMAHFSCWVHSVIFRQLCWRNSSDPLRHGQKTSEVSWGVWHGGIGSGSFRSCGLLDGVSMDWTSPSTPRRSRSDFDLGNLEARSTHWALSHVPWAIPGCFLWCGRVEGSLPGQCLDERYPVNARARGCPVEHCMLYTSPVSHSNVVANSLLKIFANMFTTSAQTAMNCQCRVLHLFQLPQGVPKISYSSSTS